MIKTIIVKNKPKRINSKSDKNKKEYGIVVKEYKNIRPEIDEVNYIVNDLIRDCRNDYFQSFEYRCVFDSKFMKMENN